MKADTVLLLIGTAEDLWHCQNALTGLYNILQPEEHGTGSTDVINLCITDVFSLRALKDKLPEYAIDSAGFSSPPILLLASVHDFHNIDHDLLAAADDFIFRPIHPAELTLRVQRQLSGKGRETRPIPSPAGHSGSKIFSVPPAEENFWYHTFFINHHIVMLLIDPVSGAILDANPAACGYYGWSRETFLQLKITDINTLPTDKVHAQMKEAGQRHRTCFDFHHRLASGAVRNVRVYSGPIKFGSREALYSLVFDITEQKQVQDMLRKERSFSSIILDSLPGVFYLYDENRQFLRWNKDFERVTGYTAAEIKQMSPLDFFAGKEKELLARRIQEVFDRTASSVEANFVTKDGREIPYFFTGRKAEFASRTCLLGVGVDISSRKQAEEEMRLSEEKFANIFQVSPAPMTITRITDGKFIDVNEAFLQTFGFRREEVIDSTTTELQILDTSEREKLIAAQIATGGLRNCELFARAKTGKVVHLLFSSKPMQIDREKCHLTTLIDITERKLAEDIILEKERFISGIVETTPAIVYVYDMQDNCNVYTNNGVHRLLGYSVHEIQQMGDAVFERLIHEDDLPKVNDFQARVMAANDGDVLSIEYRMLHREGFWLHLHSDESVYLRNDDGQVQQKIGVAFDITERRQAELELRHRAEELTTLNSMGRAVNRSLSLDATVSAAIHQVLRHTNPDLTFVFLCDGPQMRMVGHGPENAADLINALSPHLVEECLSDPALQKGKTVYSRNIHPDILCTHEEWKQAGICSFVAIPLSVGPELIGVLGLASRSERDFGEQEHFLETLASQVAAGLNNSILHEKIREHAAELEQRVARRTAELSVALDKSTEAERLKSIFLASMSHELRTPLNSIIGFTGILLMGLAGSLNPEQQKQLQMVKTNGQHLLSMINDILDISKIEAGKILPDIETFNLDVLLDEVIDTFKPQIDEKGLALTSRCPSQITLISDRRRFKQILVNLVSNAVKYTAKGQITLSCRKRQLELEVRVADTGIGIGRNNLKRLFQPFQQVGMELTKNYEGTGLGLYLCRKLAELLGGSISVRSRPGKGSVFTVMLPLELKEAGNSDSRHETRRGGLA